MDWPDFGSPEVPRELSLAEAEHRLAAIRQAMAARGLDRLVIYGDREHAANLAWATGFDPRFEEAFLVVAPDGPPLLAAGNECLPYTAIAPLVAAGRMRVAHCPGLSLISQPRDTGERIDAVLRREVPEGARIGTVGWKYWEPGEVDDPATAIEVPSLLTDVLRGQGTVVNATDLFMHPGHGLRSVISVEDVARFEFANGMAARAVRRMAFALGRCRTDFEAVEAAAVGGLPLGCHITFATGSRAAQGLSGPTGQPISAGSAISFNVCHWGANICRAGWVARGPEDLPPEAADYVEVFVVPYVQAVSNWCGLMRPGVEGGAVWDQAKADLPDALFAVGLNPGHLIGMDEWVSSPVTPGSALPLRSGMAMQCDIIPGHPVYGSTRMEDGYVIADAGLQKDLAAWFPDVALRCRQRQAFMRDVIGLDVPDELLPLADTCGIISPYLLDPGLVVCL